MMKAKKLAGAGDVAVHVQSSKKREKKKIKFDKTASITEERKIKIKKKKIMF